MDLKSLSKEARELDQKFKDTTRREKFYIPTFGKNKSTYLCGNSLGLQPKSTLSYIKIELDKWRNFGVEGHFEGDMPWKNYHQFFKQSLAKICGAAEAEVCPMNTLTVNLNNLLVSFYRPNSNKFKIAMEAGAFPSDQYAIENQVRLHGFDPEDAIIEIAPPKGKYFLSIETILESLEKNKDQLALVLMGGVNYYTGQKYDMPAIADYCQQHDIRVGFDLAHAIGNVELRLHDWKVDFAAWCSYKYLNSSPGGVGGIFVNNAFDKVDLPRLAGWWGHDEANRFKMQKGFRPMKGADAWQQSNAQILALAAHKASLDIFDEGGMPNLLYKSSAMIQFMQHALDPILRQYSNVVTQMTPIDSQHRGNQTSLLIHKNSRIIFDNLSAAGIICDYREPDCIRLAPVPLYNTFVDIANFARALHRALERV